MIRAPILIDASRVRAHLPAQALIAALREAFREGAVVPLRHRHVLRHQDTVLLMPAWQSGTAPLAGVKVVSVFPHNGAIGLPSVASTYLLMNGATGEHLAVLDGGEITGLRTAAASALAADFLARPDASRLLVLGAGHIAGLMPEAMAAVRPIASVRVWNHRPERARDLAARWRADGWDAVAVEDLQAAVGWADIISAATLSTVPLILGAWLRPGVHIDLIGAYTQAMRETDASAVRRARVFIDTDAALAEAGDLMLDPAAEICGNLAALCRGEIGGRADVSEITLFKSVGSGLEDLAAAALVYEAVSRTG